MRQPQGNTASLQHTAASNAVACCHQSFAASFSWTCFSDFSLFLSQTPTRWLFPQAAILPCPQLCTATDDDTYTKVKHLHHSMISSADTVIATASTLPHEFSAVIDCRIRLQFQIQYGAIRKRDEYAGHKDRAQWLPLCHWLTAIQRHSHQKMLPRNPPTTKCFFWEPSGKPHKVMSSTRAAELKKIALVVQMDGQRHPRRPQCHTLFAACNPFRNGCHQTHTQVPLPLREARANIRRLTSQNPVICTPPLGFQRVDVDLTTYHCRLCKEYPSALQIPVPIQYCGSTLGWGQPWVNPAP
jgi:hypothetical protein